jgi:hypothetical protein
MNKYGSHCFKAKFFKKDINQMLLSFCPILKTLIYFMSVAKVLAFPSGYKPTFCQRIWNLSPLPVKSVSKKKFMIFKNLWQTLKTRVFCPRIYVADPVWAVGKQKRTNMNPQERLTCQDKLSPLNCPGCWPVMSQLTCPYWPVPADISFLTYIRWPVRADLSWLSCQVVQA